MYCHVKSLVIKLRKRLKGKGMWTDMVRDLRLKNKYYKKCVWIYNMSLRGRVGMVCKGKPSKESSVRSSTSTEQAPYCRRSEDKSALSYSLVEDFDSVYLRIVVVYVGIKAHVHSPFCLQHSFKGLTQVSSKANKRILM